MRPMKMNINRGSHLPLLMKLMSITDGPVLEVGTGIYSTSYLHWECFRTKRKLVSYEGHPDYFHWLKACANDYHEVHFVENWDSIDLSGPWSIAFIDHAPAERREYEIKRLLHADYIVAHDTDNSQARKYGYHRILKLFKYRFKLGTRPATSVFSNKFDVRGFNYA